jgi:hypothetical protein
MLYKMESIEMKQQVFRLVCLFLALMPAASMVASDPYRSLKELPSDDSSGEQKNSPYESLSTIPGGPADERHETLQNEYSAPQDQGQ